MHRKLMLLLLITLLMTACSQDKKSSEETTNQTNGDNIPRLTVKVSEALVFERPSREANVLFRLIEGDQRPILAQTELDTLGVAWYQIGLGEQFGWIAGSQVDLSGSLASLRVVPLEVTPMTLPTITLAPSETPIIEGGGVGALIVVDEAPILAFPTSGASEIMRLIRWDTAEVIGQTAPSDSGEFYYFLAQSGEVRGWVLASNVQTQGDLTRVPLVTDALPENINPAINATESTIIQVTEEAQLATPPPTSTPRFTLTPSPTLDFASTSQAAPTATLISAATEATGLREGIPPPFDIYLPDGWQQAHFLVPVNSMFFQGDLAVTFYQGELSEGVTGSIQVIWGFPNITDLSGEINLYVDGVQLLRSVVLDTADCVVGLDQGEPRTYSIGGRAAVGTIYSAAPCEVTSEIAGFFAVLQVGGGNFAFFVGVEPVSDVSIGLRQIQTLLDTIQFDPALETQQP